MPNTGSEGKSNIESTNWGKESLIRMLSLSFITDALVLCWQDLENADLI